MSTINMQWTAPIDALRVYLLRHWANVTEDQAQAQTVRLAKLQYQ